jgi:predicted secreted protein
VGDNPISVLTADLDNDSDYDILTTNLINDTVSVLKNDGSGGNYQRLDYSTDSGPYWANVSDVNKDGEPDIITANSYADTVSVLYSNFPPSIVILEPDGIYDIANSSYTIFWEDFAPYTDAKISLYWDDDNNGFDGTEIASEISEDDDGIGGSYEWIVSDMPEGDFWVYAKIDDGTFEPRYDYSIGYMTINHSIVSNIPPTFQITEPDGHGDIANTVFTIFWMDGDPDDDATISLYYDYNDLGFDGTQIIEGVSENAHGSSGIYTWDTTDIPEGEYYIYGICNDGNNEPLKRYSTFPLNINHTIEIDQNSSTNQTPATNIPPFIQIVEPDGEDHYSDKEYMITWIDSDIDNDASISLYYDPYFTGYDGTLIVSGLSEDEHGSSGMYIWNTTLIPSGKYFIYGIIDDGLEVSRDYSPGTIIVDHTGNFNAAPKILMLTPEKGIEEADKNYTLRWGDSDSDDSASISLYYDVDPGGFDGILIVSGLDEDDENDFYIWDTSIIPSGEYYIYAKIEDGLNKAVYDYSDGKLKINHETNENGREKMSLSFILFLPFAVIIVLVLALLLRKKRNQGNEEDELKDIMEEELESEESKIPSEDVEEDNVDEELLPQSKETMDEKVDEEPLPQSEEEVDKE